jgi:hypothetical protein
VDAEELHTALGGGHLLPAGFGLLALAEGGDDGRGELGFGFHGAEEALGHLLGTLEARGVAFGVADVLADLAAGVLAEGVVPVAEAGLFVEEVGEFVGKLGFAGIEVGLERKSGEAAKGDACGALHGLVDEKVEAAFAVGGTGIREECGAEVDGAAVGRVDGAADAQAEHVGPDRGGLEGDADDGPAEGLAAGFEDGIEGLRAWLVCGFLWSLRGGHASPSRTC